MSSAALEPTADALLDELGRALHETAAALVPWFRAQLPAAYFHDVAPDLRRQHLAALVGARATGRPPSLTLRSADGRTVTAIRPADRPGLLAELLDELPDDRPLHDARVYTARDGTLVLDVFRFGHPDDAEVAVPAARAVETRDWAAAHDPDLPPEAVDAWLARCSPDLCAILSARRRVRFARLHHAVVGTDEVAVDAWSRREDPSVGMITVAAGRAAPRTLFQRCAARLGQQGLDIRRAYLDPLRAPSDEAVVFATFEVRGTADRPFVPAGPAFEALAADLRRLPWLDDRVLAACAAHPEVPLDEAEVIVALLDLVHGLLARRDPFAFSRERLGRLATAHLDAVRPLARHLLTHAHGADVPRPQADLPRDAAVLVDTLADAVAAVRAHDLARPARHGLALDLDPGWLLGHAHPERPHGVLYGHGPGYRGFHVRFRPIARGGLRVVAPRDEDRHALETERLFDEAYGLAHAQQLKNKDIPEGGSKAALLVHPAGDLDRAVRGFVDGLLDLATADPGFLLYLGPDENIRPDHLEAIVARAAARGYAQPTAFISSKPGAGINHKTYGVTSEGVQVFLDAALRARGIDPTTTPFTVRMTGGPDGDVAGNAVRILHREYGDRVRFVAIGDGSGSAHDPDGLDIAELLRLVDDSVPIARFDPARLGPGGRVVPLDAPDGRRLRDDLPFLGTSDVFLPAGGRPKTIHAGNAARFLVDGAPRSPVIVEGANLFLTPEARTVLSEAGAAVVKDSSANKCGVICSSFEIAACMLLDDDAFLAVKDRFVEAVLLRLRHLARREAELLFREHARRPDVPLPELSVRVSRTILRATDALADALLGLDPDAYALLEDLVRDHLPVVLQEAAGPDWLDRLPPAYVAQTIAATAATRVVYREGLDFLDGLDDARVASLAVAYVRADRDVHRLARALEARGTPEDLQAADLLRRGGARATVVTPAGVRGT